MSEANGYITKQDLNDALAVTKQDLNDALNVALEVALDSAFTRFSQHILHEMGARFDETRTRLDSIDSRLKLHAGLVQSGARAIAKLSDFSESSEERWVTLSARVAALERKLAGLSVN